MSTNPFLDPALVHGDLYRGSGRFADRTRALHCAKTSGSDVAQSIPYFPEFWTLNGGPRQLANDEDLDMRHLRK
ncbi:hypothetical protein [Micromonospora sp. bgisy143]|uniref:hypothetical protein n=1 Tax=Micromonospora sp. bgisy143 TaxID=3413790 RepID=UPI003EC0B347